MGYQPQSLENLIFDRVIVPWGKVEKEFANLKKLPKFSANIQLKLFKVTAYLLYNGSTTLFL